MIRSLVTVSALALALAGCGSEQATNQHAPVAPVQQAPVAPVQQAPVVEHQQPSSEQWSQQQSPQLKNMVEQARKQQERNMEQLNKQLPSNIPQVPTASPGDADYEQKMNTYRQQVNEYMCAEGNAYTVPSNQRSC